MGPPEDASHIVADGIREEGTTEGESMPRKREREEDQAEGEVKGRSTKGGDVKGKLVDDDDETESGAEHPGNGRTADRKRKKGEGGKEGEKEGDGGGKKSAGEGRGKGRKQPEAKDTPERREGKERHTPGGKRGPRAATDEEVAGSAKRQGSRRRVSWREDVPAEDTDSETGKYNLRQKKEMQLPSFVVRKHRVHVAVDTSGDVKVSESAVTTKKPVDKSILQTSLVDLLLFIQGCSAKTVKLPDYVKSIKIDANNVASLVLPTDLAFPAFREKCLRLLPVIVDFLR
eukprot:Sspe_Gene.16404::Locus_5782_Transcript_1_1_Confidence_1.000_Length_961::g.16404::m.16404